ncbi:peptide chain release factor H [Pedobacter sp. HMF7647]|uniref:Peptide chain release factor H n=1 Tax=Hufsiella arboris TaxID=2695275 RepID=A0A7K1YCZ4_9SPHI|nr:peptide chain release factor H [Hufsiella arboris]MXV52453.1 peptide chain release factor H [Hufsiella arboris]
MEEKIFLITAGSGPLECCRAVYKVRELLIAQARKLDLQVEILDEIPAEKTGALQSCTLRFKGFVPEVFMNEWQGTVQWIAASPYRPAHKRKNWFVGVEILENGAPVSWNESEVTFETFRASGPGGQNVNKVESAVRVTHQHTGIQIRVADTRSQLENKSIALKRLAQKLEALQNEQASQLRHDTRNKHLSLERGNPVKVIRGPL